MTTFQVENGDWKLNASTGRPMLVADRAKLRQDVQENLSVATQSTGFGAGLEELLGRAVDPAAFRLEVSRRIRTSIDTLQRLQAQRAGRRSGSERIATLTALTVTTADAGSKTGYAFRLVVAPMAGELLPTAGTLVV